MGVQATTDTWPLLDTDRSKSNDHRQQKWNQGVAYAHIETSEENNYTSRDYYGKGAKQQQLRSPKVILATKSAKNN